jgi:hypothetical protein
MVGVLVERQLLGGPLRDLQACRLLPVTVTRLPARHEDEVALLTVVTHLRRIDWDRVAVGVVAAHHLWLTVTLLFAPHAQVFTQGTLPAFDLWSPPGWALWFGLGGLAAIHLILRVTAWAQAIAWFAVFPAQVTWLGASVIAITSGGGSAVGVVVWTVVIAFTGLAAIRLAIDYATGKR